MFAKELVERGRFLMRDVEYYRGLENAKGDEEEGIKSFNGDPKKGAGDHFLASQFAVFCLSESATGIPCSSPPDVRVTIFDPVLLAHKIAFWAHKVFAPIGSVNCLSRIEYSDDRSAPGSVWSASEKLRFTKRTRFAAEREWRLSIEYHVPMYCFGVDLGEDGLWDCATLDA